MEQQVRMTTLGGTRVQKVRDIDFRRPMKFTRDQLRVLERAHDGFCRSASSRLSAELRSEITFNFMTSDQLPYAAVVGEELSQQVFMLVLEAQPTGTKFALVMEIPTVLSLINRNLGGEMTEQDIAEGMTELEMAVAKRSLIGFIDSLSDTWSDMCGITFKMAEVETSPMAVQLVPPSEPTLLLTFSAQIENSISLVTLVAPWRSVEPVMDAIARAQQDIVEEPGKQGAVARALGRVEVSMCAEIGSVEMEVGKLLAHKPGDTIVFPCYADAGVTVTVDGNPVYQGQPGTHESSRAVQITEVLKQV